jgi:hypothetical protein
MVREGREAWGSRLLAGFVAAGLSLLAFSASADAATIPVTNTSDAAPAPPGSLRAAIEAANSDTDLDVVDASGVTGTINLGTALPILAEDIEIRGPGAGALTVRRGIGVMSSFRILTVNPGVTAAISDLTIASGNVTGSSDGGAGIYNNRGTVTLRGTVVTGNVNSGSSNGADGGGILNWSISPASAATMTIVDSAISGNRAAGSGAGIDNADFSTLTVRRSLVSGNTSGEGAGCMGGGGIKNDGVLRVENSTVAGNSVPGPPVPAHGGGIISCGDSGSATIVNSTIASNSAGTGANLSIDRLGSAATLRSSVVADPRGGGANCFVDGPPDPATLTSTGFNLASDASCKLTNPTDQPSTNPLLGPLASNGGPTLTMALPLNSPAVDKGIRNGLTTDQRGLTRPVDFPKIPNAPGGDGTDIGAFEVQAPPEPPGPSNEFSFGKVKKNKKKGTAKLTIEIEQGPGELDLAKTKKVKADDEAVEAEGDEKLNIKPKGKATKKLRKNGNAKVKAEVTYTPDGGEPNMRSKKVKLKLKRR